MNKISGKVVVKESGIGIPDLLIVVYDLDPECNVEEIFSAGTPLTNTEFWSRFKGDRIGSVLTSPSGSFELTYEDSEFQIRNEEKRPDLILLVMAPEEPESKNQQIPISPQSLMLYFSNIPRVNAGRTESYVIRLLAARLDELGLAPRPQSFREFDPAAIHKESIQRSKQIREQLIELHKPRAERILAIQEKAKNALKDFVPTRLPPLIRNAPTFLGPGRKLGEAQGAAVEAGAARIARATQPLVLRLTPEENQQLLEIVGDENAETVEVRIEEFLQIVGAPNGEETITRTFDFSDLCPHPAETAEDDDGEAAPVDGDGTADDSSEPSSEEIVISLEEARRALLSRTLGQVADLKTWDPQVIEGRNDISKLKKMIDDLKISKGPADVTAFHDFNSVQVAFDHVWAEVYDKRLVDIGKRTLRSWEQFKEFVGATAEDEDPWLTADDAEAALDKMESEADALAETFVVPGEVNLYWGGNITPQFFAWLGEDRRQALTLIAAAATRGELTVEFMGGVGAGVPIPEVFTYDPRISGQSQWSSRFAPISVWHAKVGEWRQQFLDEMNMDRPPVPGVLEHDESSWGRVKKMIRELRDHLKEAYSFKVFAPNSVNYGLVVTYRQKWEPLNYQVGELVGTIPLAPGESRKFSTTTTIKKSRTQLEAEESMSFRRSESSVTTRAEAEILRRAGLKSSFDYSTSSGLGGGNGDDGGNENRSNTGTSSTTNFGLDVESESRRAKKNFRESVLKAVEEFKRSRKLEVKTSTEETIETTTSGELSNPNNELTVTYLLYELQRQYEVSERIHKVTPVIFVAQDVPAPHEIDEDWLIIHEWILRRVLLDDSFRDAFDYLTDGLAGDEFTVEALREQWKTQREMVVKTEDQVQRLTRSMEQARQSVASAIRSQTESQGIFEDIGEFFGGGEDDAEKARARVEAAERALEFVQSDLADTRTRLAAANDAYQESTRKLTEALRQQVNHRIAIDQLRAHIKDNILYYLHAIWDHEVPDQRFLRLYHLPVPFPNCTSDDPVQLKKDPGDEIAFGSVIPGNRYANAIPSSPRIPEAPVGDRPTNDGASSENTEKDKVHSKWGIAGNVLANEYKKSMLDGTRVGEGSMRRLIEIADVGNPLGFWGNYIILPLRESNCVTTFMARSYVDDFFGVWDPDLAGNYTTDELVDYMECVQGKVPSDVWERLVDQLTKRLMKPSRDKDLVVVPSEHLFIEALPGSHPILEDFKLLHRAVDVSKVVEEVRNAQLDSLRRAWRLIESKLDDPDIDKQIIVSGNGVTPTVDTGGVS